MQEKELLEVKYNHARVSEQVMATYFFYKVFIKDEILSFKTLLFTFFPLWKKRFTDTIIPSNNSFGYKNVLNKINGVLDDYLNSIYVHEEKVLEFFSLFWFYKREEMLSYFQQNIKQFPEPKNPFYDTKYKTNDFVWDRDKTLDIITNLFNHFTESFTPALELAFEYCRKKPESLPELIRRIKEKLVFDDDDFRLDFKRQVELFNLLTARFQDKQPHYIAAFFALTETFLSHHYQVTKGGKNHSITFYQYPLPYYEVTKDFRKSIWSTLFENFNTYPIEVFSILKKFRPGFKEAIPEILEFDLSFLLPFIEGKLDPSSFEHIHFVHDFVTMLDREKLSDRGYQNLRNKFNSKEYEYFRKLDWNKHRGRQDYDYKNNDEFRKLKEQDIRFSFVFNSEDEFTTLHVAIKNTLELEGNNNWGINQSLNIIIEENFIQNNELGFKLLIGILKNYPTGLNPLYNVIKVITNKSREWAFRLWKLINEWNHESKLFWQLSFFDYLPSNLANSFYKNALLKTIRSIDKECYLQFESYEKFIPIKSDKFKDRAIRFFMNVPFINYKEKTIIEEILSIVYNKIEYQNLRINLSFYFFEKYSEILADNFELLKKSYIQQEKKININFDPQHSGLKKLIHIKPEFLLEYVDSFYTDKVSLSNQDTHIQLSFVWDMDNYYALIKKAVILITDKNYYSGILEHPLIIFFNNLSGKQKIKAKTFLLNFISDYNADEKKMNPVFDILRYTLKGFFEEALLHYLSLNTNVDNFKKVSWIGVGGTYSGDSIIGEIHAMEWQNILEMVKTSEYQLDLIPIKTYIKRQIENEIKNAEKERKRRFINPEGW